MDPRRYSRVIDPKVRQVGFCPRSGQVQNQSGPTGPSTSPPVSHISPSSNSLSPVMIPPPRHPSDAASRAVNVPAAATTPLRPRRPSFDDPNNNSSSTEQLVVSSYNPDESVLGTSPPFSGIGDDRDGDAESEFSDNSVNWIRQNDSGRFPLSLAPDGRFDSAAAKEKQSKKPQVGSRKERGGGQTAEVRNDLPSESKPLKEKTSKAERRALQEAQRAVKAAAKGSSTEIPVFLWEP